MRIRAAPDDIIGLCADVSPSIPHVVYVRPHYHINHAPAQFPNRHQILVCQRGRLRVGVYTVEGERLGLPTLQAGDLLMLCEGHSLEFLDPDTKVIEIKMGPFPGSDEADKEELHVDPEPVRESG